MRRLRPHRLTGSLRRMLAAVFLAGLGAAAAGSMVARATTAVPPAGLGADVGLPVSVGLPSLIPTTPAVPSLLPPAPQPPPAVLPPPPAVPPGSAPPPLFPPQVVPPIPALLPPTPAPAPSPTLPASAPLGPVCAATCAPAQPGTTVAGGPSSGVQGSGASATTTAPLGLPVLSQAASGLSLVAAPSSAAVAAPDSARQSVGGLGLPPPPPVEQLTPLAGISFGPAPYLWPAFLVLDVVAAAAVVMVVRRTWSPAPGPD